MDIPKLRAYRKKHQSSSITQICYSNRFSWSNRSTFGSIHFNLLEKNVRIVYVSSNYLELCQSDDNPNQMTHNIGDLFRNVILASAIDNIYVVLSQHKAVRFLHSPLINPFMLCLNSFEMRFKSMLFHGLL